MTLNTKLSQQDIELLASGSPEERANANLKMYMVYQNKDSARASVHLHRAWRLGHNDKQMTLRLANALFAKGDHIEVINILKQSIYNAARTNNVKDFLELVPFYHQITVGLDQKVQDLMIHDLTEKMLSPLRMKLSEQSDTLQNDDKLHLVYVLPLPKDDKSTLPPIPFEQAMLHDKDKFKISIVVPLGKDALKANNERLLPLIEKAAKQGIETHYFEMEHKNYHDNVIALQKFLHDMDIDILFFMLQIYTDYFISALRPARHIVTMDFGNPDWYTSPFADVAITSNRHLAMETLCPNKVARVGMTRQKQEFSPSKLTRRDLNIGTEKKLIISSGAADRFHVDFWKMVLTIVSKNNVDWLFMGPEPELKDTLFKSLNSSVASRIHFLGYRTDFQNVMSLGDIYVDTYPIGGGWAMIEAMSQNIPCITYEHDYNRVFRKTENYFPLYDYAADSTFAVPFEIDKIEKRLKDFISSEKAVEDQLRKQADVLKIVNNPQDGIKELDQALLEIAGR